MVTRTALVLLAALTVTSTSLGAPTGADYRAARGLALEAAKAQRAGDYARAVELLEQANERGPSSQIRLDLARAQVKLGRLVEAEALLEGLLAPNASPRTDWRVGQAAKKLLATLKDQVPQVTIEVGGADAARAIVELDGQTVTVGQPVKANLGSHRLQAYAEGMQDIERTISLGVGERPTVTLGFEPVPPPPVPPAPTSSGVGRKALTAVAFGLGGAGAALGSAFGLLAIADKDKASEHCVGDRCEAAAQPFIDASLTKGNVATASFIVGGVGIATGVVLLLTAGPAGASDEGGSSAAIVPWVGPMGAGVSGVF